MQLPDTIQEFYQAVYNTVTSVATLVHCKHELMQAIIALLLDEESMHAYEYGILMEFADGIMHRVFPRIFTYSADYPEKYVSNMLSVSQSLL